jgi:hypothetical protein
MKVTTIQSEVAFPPEEKGSWRDVGRYLLSTGGWRGEKIICGTPWKISPNRL